MIGRIFWHGAIAHVAPDLDVDGLLDDLLLRDFVLAEPRSTIIGERAYRFKHMLIREVAYAGLTKGDRAELHARFAEWLQERAGDELLEIRAYHLDHAAQLLAELDGRRPAELAAEAAAALEEAGRRALARESNRSGRKLLLRAVELEPTLERRYQAARAAWRMTRPADGLGRDGQGARRGQGRRRPPRSRARRSRRSPRSRCCATANLPRATELIDAALEALPDGGALRRARRAARKIAWTVGDFEVMEQAAEEAVEIAQRLGRKDLEAQALNDMAHVYRKQDRQDEAEERWRSAGAQLARRAAASSRARRRCTRSASSTSTARGRPRANRCSRRRAPCSPRSADTGARAAR